MAYEKQTPKWDAAGIEPPESKQQTGWQVEDRPPAAWLNWYMNGTSESIKELQEKAAEKQWVEEQLDEREVVRFPEASLAVKGIVQLSSVTEGLREDVAATERAVGTRAPIESPIFKGTPKVGINEMIHTGNINSFSPPPIEYDGNTSDLLIYVNASTGNDKNDGLSTSTAKRTIAAGLASLPKVSPRSRMLCILGNFNETAIFRGFVGGNIGIYCTNNGTNTALLRGLEFHRCVVGRYHIYNLTIADYDSSNQTGYYPLSFEECSGYANVSLIAIKARVFGVSVQNSGGYFSFEGINLTAASGVSVLGEAFGIRNTSSVFISSSTSSTVFSTGINSTASTVYAKLTGINGVTQTSKTYGGQIFTF